MIGPQVTYLRFCSDGLYGGHINFKPWHLNVISNLLIAAWHMCYYQVAPLGCAQALLCPSTSNMHSPDIIIINCYSGCVHSINYRNVRHHTHPDVQFNTGNVNDSKTRVSVDMGCSNNLNSSCTRAQLHFWVWVKAHAEADVNSHSSTSGQVRSDWLKFTEVSYRLFYIVYSTNHQDWLVSIPWRITQC